MPTLGGANIGPLQLCILAILILMTLAGLYYTSTGETIPGPVYIGFFGGVFFVIVGVIQSFGGFKQHKEEDPDVEIEATLQKKREKKDAKRLKKESVKAQTEAQEEAERTAKKNAKLAAAKAAKDEEKKQKEAEAEAKRLEDEKRRQEEEAKKAKTKKNKKKKEKEPKDTRVEPEEKDEEVKEVKEVKEPAKPSKPAEPDDWVVQPSQKELRDAKKAARVDAPRMTVEMLVSSKHHAVIVGSEKSMQTKIEQTYNVTLTFPRKNSGEEKITIEGTEHGIGMTKQVIHEICDHGYSKTLDSNMDDIWLTIPNLGLLLAGDNLKNIRLKTSARIVLPDKEKDAPPPAATKTKGKGNKAEPQTETKKGEAKERRENRVADIHIMGDANAVRRAAEAIRQLMDQGHSEITHEGQIKATIPFPSSLTGTLMGTKGERVRDLQKRTNTRIEIPSFEAKTEKPMLIHIGILGKPADVEKVRNEILGLQANFLTREVDIPQPFVSLFAGAQGTNKVELAKRTKTRIDICEHLWDPAMRTICISGFDRDIRAVEAEIAALLQDNTIFKMDFPDDRLPLLIGAGGEKIQNLQKETGTRIHCDPHDWDVTVKTVTVVGRPENVRTVAQKLEDLRGKTEKEPEPAAAVGFEQPALVDESG